MNAAALLAHLQERNVDVTSLGADLLIDAPRGALTEELREAIAKHKAVLIHELNGRPEATVGEPASPLVAYAADRLPSIRLTFRETYDLARDFTVLDALRSAIRSYEPGGNRIRLRLTTLDGRRFLLEWRAQAERGLRLDLARVLAAEGTRRSRAGGRRNDERMVVAHEP
jgi:hypothetical protein